MVFGIEPMVYGIEYMVCGIDYVVYGWFFNWCPFLVGVLFNIGPTIARSVLRPVINWGPFWWVSFLS